MRWEAQLTCESPCSRRSDEGVVRSLPDVDWQSVEDHFDATGLEFVRSRALRMTSESVQMTDERKNVSILIFLGCVAIQVININIRSEIHQCERE